MSSRTARVSVLLAAALGLSMAGLSLGPVSAAGATGSPSAGGKSAAASSWAHARTQQMTLEEKVGQLFVAPVYGDRADTTDPADVAANQKAYGVSTGAQVIDKYKLGGVIYFAWSNNVKNPPQIAGLSNGLQHQAMAQRLPIPLLISTDQEQGVVYRVGPPATQFPGNMALGAGRSPQDAKTAASITGQELRAIGINQDFAPVSDVNVNALNPVIGVRSFSSDPDLVSSLASSQVEGYQGANVAATAKHFPGHGDTSVDSHTGIPVISHSRQQWEAIDQPPFTADIAKGIDAIMTAHIIVPSLDPSGDPATLSNPIITGILRNQMHYDGLVITDSLGMAGVRQKYGDDRVPVLALKAGVDQLLMPPNFDLAFSSVLAAVRNGEISESRIDQSVFRVLRLKYERGLFKQPYVNEAAVPTVVGTPAHYAAAQQITDKTVTLVKNDGQALPLTPASTGSMLVTGAGVTAALAGKIAARGVSADAFETGLSPSDATIQAAVAQAQAHDRTVVATNKAWSNAAQQKLVKALLDTGKPVIVVAVRDPYDIAYFTAAPTYLATYSYTDVSLESLTRVLFGEITPTGLLPVTIPVAGSTDTLYPFGYGLSW
ncbi:MAG: glycoside hydrolase family 3 protein [Mycobacteriales bacterium]